MQKIKIADVKEPFFIKIYIVLLFVLGIVVYFSSQDGNKQKVKADIELDNKITAVLSANFIEQADIISQFEKSMENKTALWIEYNKKIMIRDQDLIDKFDSDFRTLARSMDLGLARSLNADGSITYRFYTASQMTYSNITFVISRRRQG